MEVESLWNLPLVKIEETIIYKSFLIDMLYNNIWAQQTQTTTCVKFPNKNNPLKVTFEAIFFPNFL